MKLLSSKELGERKLEPIRYAVEGMIPEGYTVLSALPKIGKSWFAQQMCLAVAEGKEFLGHKTTQGTTIYIALEDCEKFAQDRQKKIGTEGTKAFKYVFDAPPMAMGFIDELDKVAEGIDDLRLVVVDTLRRIEYKPEQRESLFQCEYRTGMELKEWADRHEVSLVAITHDRKDHSGDPLGAVSGTGGVTAAADSVVMITKENRYGDTANIGVTGRRVLTSLGKIRQNESCVWETVENDEYKDSQIRRVIEKIADDGIKESLCAKQIKDMAVSKGITLTESSRAIGGFIMKYKGKFWEDGIDIKYAQRGTASKTYQIRRVK